MTHSLLPSPFVHSNQATAAPRRAESAGRVGHFVMWGALLGFGAVGAQAQTMPGSAAPVAPAVVAPTGVVSLTATATIEVMKDVLGVSFTTTKEGADAQAVQSSLKQALDAALNEARKIAKPGQVDVQTGSFSLYPRYSNKGVISGWHGTAELQVRGKDIPAIAQLTGRIQTMSIARVGYDLSRETREKFEGEVTAQAIARYRGKAAEVSKQFGFANYVIREVQVTTDEPGGQEMPMMRARVSAAPMADEPLPTQPGKGQVSATVSGTVQMLR